MIRTLKALALTAALLTTAFEPVVSAQTAAAKPRLNIAILIFPKAEVIDYAGPMEVFAQFSQSYMPHNIFTVGEKSEPIQTNGPTVVPDFNFSNHPRPDVLIIPGGGGPALLQEQENDPTLIKWIQDNAREARYVLSVCNGAFILAKTGLLDGLSATTTAGLTGSLSKAYPRVKVVSDQRYVDNGKLITSSGLSSGIDASLHIIERLHGKAWARSVAMEMEYNWQPHSKYVRAQLADMKMPSTLYELVLPSGKFISTGGGIDKWKEEWSVQPDVPAAKFLGRLDDGLTTQDKWSRMGNIKSTGATGTSQWKFVDDRGREWRGLVGVKTVITKNEILVSVTIIRSVNRKK